MNTDAYKNALQEREIHADAFQWSLFFCNCSQNVVKS